VANCDSLRPVSGSFTGVEPLGNPRKPSALCAIVDLGRVEISEMITDARGPVLAAAGAPEDRRPPLPHMTLARVQRRASASERREALRWARGIDLRGLTFTVSEVALYTWAEDRQERLFKTVERRELVA
jgi:2'-5' RNA ligase